MRSLLVGVALGLAALGSSSAFAADSSSGCGPGWYVFKDTSLVSSSLRAITNGILFPTSTLGMTFGTSNCAKHKIVRKDSEALRVTTLAYHDLLIQTAKGQGEHLGALAATLGCPWQAQERFNRAMQAGYESLFPADETAPELVLDAVEARVQADPALATACAAPVG